MFSPEVLVPNIIQSWIYCQNQTITSTKFKCKLTDSIIPCHVHWPNTANICNYALAVRGPDCSHQGASDLGSGSHWLGCPKHGLWLVLTDLTAIVTHCLERDLSLTGTGVSSDWHITHTRNISEGTMGVSGEARKLYIAQTFKQATNKYISTN